MTSRIRSLLGCCSLLVLLSACVSTPKLSEEHQRLESVSEFNVFITQESLELDQSNLQAHQFGGGLLGLMLSSATNEVREKRADKAFDQLREAMQTFELQGPSEDIIRKTMDRSLFPGQTEPSYQLEYPEERYPVSLNNVLDIQVTYHLSNKMDRLLVNTALMLFDVTRKRMNSGEVRHDIDSHYRATYTYYMNAPEPKRESGVSRRDEYEQAWLDGGVEYLRDEILAGVTESIRMMNTDLRTRSQPVETGQRARFKSHHLNKTITAGVIQETSDRVWAVDKFNHYFSIRKQDLIKLY